MCCSRSHREAFTLVEVIASLLLLSSLLVAILLSHSKHAQQIRSAKEQMVALAAAESLLSEWAASGQTGAPAQRGKVPGEAGLAWTWEVIETPELKPLGAAVGRLKIVSATGQPTMAIDVVTSGSIALPPAPSRWY